MEDVVSKYKNISVMNNTTPEAVSVVMCTYNGAKFLKEQLDSILEQTYPIKELIIQDDCSTDETWDIIMEYALNHDVIQACRNDSNLGFNENFKEAILKASGDYVAIADQDDIWYADKIEKQVRKIGQYDVCISYYHSDREFKRGEMKKCSKPHYNLEYLLFYNSTPGHSMLMRTDFVRDIFSVWDGHIVYDWWISVNAQLGRGIVRVDEALNWHRPHSASAITKLNARYAAYMVNHPTWQPYLMGYVQYKRLQKLPTWQFLYHYVLERTDRPSCQLAHKLCRLLLKKDFFSLFRLCCLCMRHKKQVYFDPEQTGVMSYVRSFFYPMIRSYGNTYFYL